MRQRQDTREPSLSYFLDSFSTLDFSHLGVKGIDTLPTPLHNKR
jgi:hypothetical protein